MTSYDLTPLLRSSVGFDVFDNIFDSVFNLNESSTSYPPYNIIKSNNNYTITMAIAGFTKDEVDISVEEMPEVTNKSLAKEIYNFPTSVLPYNSMYDIKRKLPLFTKSVKSKSLYCAGYYIIRFEKGWVKSFCPKLITIERYDFKGPFKTEIEMRQELSRV